MTTSASIPVSDLTDEEFERRTLDAIVREFGPAGLPRFLTAHRFGKGDYTTDRHTRTYTLHPRRPSPQPLPPPALHHNTHSVASAHIRIDT